MNARESWIKRLFRVAKKTARTRRPRLVLESLEERIAPSAFLVSNTNDSGGGSLRQAITDSNTASGSNTINFSGVAGTIVLTSGALPTVTDNLTITGPGASLLSVSGNSQSQILLIGSSLTVAISGLTFTNAVDSAANGGAIYNDGALAISNCVFTNDSGSSGGALFNDTAGALTVANCTFNNDSATAASGNGGAICNFGTAWINASSLVGDTAANSGGGIYNGAMLNVSDSTIAANSATFGGGITCDLGGTLSVSGSTITGNAAASGNGGGIDDNSGTTNLLSSIVVGNVVTGTTTANDIGGTLNAIESSFNLLGSPTGGLTTANSNQVNVSVASAGLASANVPISSAVESSTTVTITTAASNWFVTGETVAISQLPGGYDGSFPIAVINSTQFSYTATSGLAAASDGSAVAVAPFSYGGPTPTIPLLPSSAALQEGAALTTLSTSITATTNPLPVADTTFLSVGMMIQIDNEQMQVVQINSGTSVTVVRGVNATGHSASAAVSLATDQRGQPRSVSGLTDVGAFETQASPFLVTTTSDPGLTSGVLALREAVNLLNALPGSNAVTFAAALSGSTIVLTQGPLALLGASGTESVSGNVPMTISGNSASNALIIDSGVTAAISSLTIANGVASGDGGGIDNFGALTVSNGTFSNDSAAFGGAIDTETGGSLTVVSSAFSSDSATQNGGAIFSNGPVSASASSFTSDTANNGGGIFAAGSALTLTNCTFNLDAANLNQGSGGNGGGVDVSAGTAILTDDSFTTNMAAFGGGLSGFGAPVGVSDCTFNGNTASTSGGGIFNAATLDVNSSTIAGNTAGNGGGIDSANSGTLAVSSSTITGNAAASGAGGGINVASGTASLLSTIVVGNVVTNTSTANDLGGSLNFSESTNNLIGSPTGGLTASNGNQVNVSVANAGLGVLENNGGQTNTIALNSGSLAIGAGSSTLTSLTSSLSTTTAMTFTVADATFLGLGMIISINGEQMQIIALAGKTITVTRAVDETLAETQSSGSVLVVPMDQRNYIRETFNGQTDVGAYQTQLPPQLVPSQVTTAYGINQVNFNGVTGNGAGQTIAIIDAGDDPKLVNSTSPSFSSSDLYRFDHLPSVNLPDPPSFTVIGETGGARPTYNSVAIASATESSKTVTITTSTPHNLSLNQEVVIANVGVSGYDGTFTITSVPSSTTFTYTASSSGFGASSGGTATPQNPASEDDAGETSLDVEWAHAMAPAANIILIELSAGLFDTSIADAANTAVAEGASVVSMSFGGGEFSGETSTATSSTSSITSATESGNTVTIKTSAALGFESGNSITVSGVGVSGYNGTFQVLSAPTAKEVTFTDPTAGLASTSGGTAAIVAYDDAVFNHPGVTFVASSGDTGAPLENPSSAPDVLGVGATNLNLNPNNSYNNETAWSNPATISSATESGGMVTLTTSTSTGLAVGDTFSITGNSNGYNGFFTVLTNNSNSTVLTYRDSTTGLSSSSGGTVYGSIFTGTGNTGGSSGGESAYEAEPAYQEGVQNSQMRDAPDVGFVGGSVTPALLLDSDGASGNADEFYVIGTSLAAPCWAGLVAIADQGRALAGEALFSSSSTLQDALYLAPSSDFHQITDGYNGAAAAAGYDTITGLGSPVANNLLPALVNTLLYTAPSGTNNFLLKASGGNLVLLDNSVQVAAAPLTTTSVVISGGTDNSLTINYTNLPAGFGVNFSGGSGTNTHTLTLENGDFSSETYGFGPSNSGVVDLGSDTVMFSSVSSFADQITSVHTLALRNNTVATNETYTYTGAGSGTIQVASTTATFSITLTYGAVSSIADANNISSLSLTLPTAAAATLQDNGIAGDGISEITSSNSGFALTTFVDPSSSLTVTTAGGSSVVQLGVMDSSFATTSEHLTGASGDVFELTSASALTQWTAITLTTATLIFDVAGTVTYAGAVSGSGSIVQEGGGALTLTGSNTFTGSITINSSSTLQVGSGGSTGAIAAASTINDNGAFIVDKSSATTLSGVVSGTGSLTQAGTGTTTLTNADTYSGGTTISAGTLQIGSGSTTGSITGNVTDNGVFAFDLSSSVTFSGVISGAGSLTQIGAGTTTLTGTDTYSGGTTISAGTLQIGSGGSAGSITGNVTDSATLTTDLSSGLTLSGVISGTGKLTQIGTGTTILTGADTYSGGTTISAGTLQIGNGGAAGSITGAVTDNAAFTIDLSSSLTLSGIISGTGSLTQAGTGTTILTGADTYSGGTTISAGTLQIGSGGTTGSITGNVSDNGALTFDLSSSVTFSGVVSGAGSLSQAGTGTTILTGADTYSGGTTISAGTLQIGNGSTTGSITGNVSDNGKLAIDLSTSFALGGVISGAGSLTQSGTGATTLTGADTYSGGTTISAGTLQIGNGGTAGSITGNVTDSATLTIDLSSGLTLNGVISGTGKLTQIGAGTTSLTGADTYSGGTTISSGTLQIGNGGTTGSITGNVTDNAAFAIDLSSSLTLSGVISGSGSLTQTGTGTTILTGADTYSGGTTVNAGTLQIGSGGSTGSITGNVTDNGAFAFDLSSSVTFSSVISGTGSLTQTGTGTTILTGADTYSGGTTISAGTLQIGNGGTAGSIIGNVTDNGKLAVDLSASFALGGAISGAGSLTQSGAGTTTLTGADNYSGGTTISAGTLQIGNGGTAGSITGNVTDNAAMTIDLSGGLALSGGVSGSGNLTQSGTGTTTLTGANTYSGGTTISVGTLQIGNGGATGSITGNVTDNAAFTIDLSASLSLGGVISGSGSLTQAGAGTTSLTGADNYSGGTTLSAGTLQIGNGGTTGSITGNVTDNGTFTFDLLSSITFSGGVSGAGSLTQAGTGTTTLTGADTYSGGTIISAGTLQIGNGGTAGSITGNVTDNGALAIDLSASLALGGAISGTGSLTQAGAGTTTLTGADTYSGGTTISAGTLQIGNGGTAGSILGTVTNNAALTIDLSSGLTLGGVISGTGNLTQSGTSTTTLTGVDTYSGGTTISAGALQIGNGGSTGSIIGNVSDNSVLLVDLSSGLTLSGIISGSGSVVQADAGTTTLTGSNSYAGSTTITAGTLSIAADNNLGTAPGSATPGDLVINGGALLATSTFALNSNRGIALGSSSGAGSGEIDVAAGQTLTYAGILANNGSGTGGLVVGSGSNTGALTLGGASTFTGAASVDAGLLDVTGSLSSGSTVTVASGATLGGNQGTVGPVIVNGNLTPGGPALLTTGQLNFGSAASFNVALDGTTAGSGYDRVVVDSAGGVNLSNGPTLNVTLGFTPAKGAQFTIMQNQGGGAFSGAFSNLPEGGTLTVSNQLFSATYLGGAGHDLVLTALGAATTATLTDNGPGPSNATQPVSLSVQVSGGSPTGLVQIEDTSNNNAVVASATLTAAENGALSLTIPADTIFAGAHNLAAVYAGDSNFAGSTSNTVNQQVSLVITSVTVNGNPGNTTITSASENASNLVTITSAAANGFTANEAVTISVTGQSGYNGIYDVTPTSATTFTYQDNNASGLTSVSGASAGTAVNAMSGNQRSMVTSIVYVFSEPVNTLTASDFTLGLQTGVSVNGGPGQTVGNTTGVNLSVSNPSGDGVTWVVTFSGTGITAGSLTNGVYTMLANTSLITSQANPTQTAQARATDTFARLFGSVAGEITSQGSTTITVKAANANACQAEIGLIAGEPGYQAYFDASGAGTRSINASDLQKVEADIGETFTSFLSTI
jgi:autotransporter-associated beta strand protein